MLTHRKLDFEGDFRALENFTWIVYIQCDEQTVPVGFASGTETLDLKRYMLTC